MAPTDAPAGETWRTFFQEAIVDDVRRFVQEYPAERSLYVDVFDLHRFDEEFVGRLFADPDRVLRQGTETLRAAHDAIDRVNLRLQTLPSQLSLGAVRTRHRSKLVSVDGNVEAVGSIEASVRVAVFACDACGATEVDRPLGIELVEPTVCSECGTTGTTALDRGRSSFVDVQRVVLSSGDDDRSTARTMPIYLDDDLVDSVSEGENLRVTGIVRLDPHPGENRFRLYLDGLTVEEQTPGQVLEERDVDEQLKETIRSRWSFVVDE